VDHLVAGKSRERGTENLFAFSIHQDFHKSLGFAFFKRATDIFHCIVEISAGLPVLRTSASVMPTRPSGGSV
jgi:hypothetical protein